MTHPPLEYTVSHRRVRYARIDMREGELMLILPHGTDPGEFVERHYGKIKKMYDEVNEIKRKAMEGVKEGYVELLGREYRLVEDCKARPFIEKNELHFCPKDYRRTREFIKGMLRPGLERRVSHYSEMTGLSAERIFIKEQVTKWGSCSSRGNLNFNLRLAFVPSDFLNYIVLHEVLHLRHMNHGKEFKRELRALYGKELPTKDEMMRHWLRSGHYLRALGKE